MGVRTHDHQGEPWRGLPGPGAAETFLVGGLVTLLLLANGRPIGEPVSSGLAGLVLGAVAGLAGLVVEVDAVGRSLLAKLLSAVTVGVTAGALFAAVARRRSMADARVVAIVLALGTTLWAASHTWSGDVPAAASVAVALLLLCRAEAEDDPAPAAAAAVPLALAVGFDPTAWGLASVLALATVVRWRRAALRLLLWMVPSAVVALGAVAVGAGSGEASSGGLAVLFSPARGAVFFAPALLVALAGVPRVLRPPRGSQRWDQQGPDRIIPLAAVAAALVHLTLVVLFGEGGSGPFWGPRGLAPAWPALLLILPEGLSLLRLGGILIVALSVVVQAVGALGYDGRWDRLYGSGARTWDLMRSPLVFQVQQRIVRLAVPGLAERRLVVRQHPMVVPPETGSALMFFGQRPLVSGADPTLGDALLEGGARVVADRVDLSVPEDALVFRVTAAARQRRLELRIDGTGSGTLGVGQSTFWTPVSWSERPVAGRFRLRLAYSYAESKGGDIRIAPLSGAVSLTKVTLVPPGEPENVIRLGE